MSWRDNEKNVIEAIGMQAGGNTVPPAETIISNCCLTGNRSGLNDARFDAWIRLP